MPTQPQGGYPGAPFCEGQVPGLEGCGTIERVGAGTKLAVGQRVSVTGHSAAKGRGTWQTYVAADESDVVPVSDKIDDFMAATFFINPVGFQSACCVDLLRANFNFGISF